MTGWTSAIRLMPVLLTTMTTSVMSQTLAVDNGPPIILERSDSNAALLAPPIDPSWVPPREVVRMLRSTGYDVLSRPRLRGAIFSVVVVSPRGDDGRIFVDARDGRLLRFVPGYALNGRTEDEIGLAYNPPGVPPASAAPLRKPQPAPAPRTASRAPPATAGSAPQSQAPMQAPSHSNAGAPPAAARSETQALVRPAEPKPVGVKPPVTLQPTQEMPPALGLE